MDNYKFIKYESIYSPDIVLYALEKNAVKKEIDGVIFIEVTPNFKEVRVVRLDSLKPIGSTIVGF